jgi:hypothetical protein
MVARRAFINIVSGPEEQFVEFVILPAVIIALTFGAAIMWSRVFRRDQYINCTRTSQSHSDTPAVKRDSAFMCSERGGPQRPSHSKNYCETTATSTIEKVADSRKCPNNPVESAGCAAKREECNSAIDILNLEQQAIDGPSHTSGEVSGIWHENVRTPLPRHRALQQATQYFDLCTSPTSSNSRDLQALKSPNWQNLVTVETDSTLQADLTQPTAFQTGSY